MMNFRKVSARFALLCGLLFALVNSALAFEAQSTWGGAGGGSANAQTIAIRNVQSLSNVLGVPLRYVPATDNTGPATIAIGGLSPIAVRRPTSIGLQPLSGGELQAGVTMTVMYNGSTIEIVGPIDMTPIGRTVEFRGSATPRGVMIEDGSCVSRTLYAALFSVVSTSYGICDGATTFGLPISNGRAFVALDNQGAATANVITSAGSGCDATVIGLCGSQSRSISTTYLPASGLSVAGLSVPGLSIPSLSVSGLSVPGLSVPGLSVPGLSVPSLSVSSSFNQNALSVPVQGFAQTGSSVATKISQGSNNGGAFSLALDGGTISVTGTTGTGTTGTGTTGTGTTGGGTTGTGTTGTGTTGGGTTGGGTTGNMGTGTAFPVLNPISIGRRGIKF
jgi:microcystin-dependent protein